VSSEPGRSSAATRPRFAAIKESDVLSVRRQDLGLITGVFAGFLLFVLVLYAPVTKKLEDVLGTHPVESAMVLLGFVLIGGLGVLRLVRSRKAQ
jgi:hypothetical protein